MPLTWTYFTYACYGQSLLNITLGSTMIFRLDAIARAAHGSTNADKLLTGPQAAQVRASERMIGVLVTSIGIFLGVAGSSKDVVFQKRWSVAALVVHGALFVYRFVVQRKVEVVAKEAGASAVMDVVLAATWVPALWELRDVALI
ncbi:hypothetical protein HDV00_002341 [Rhizophlyctis rosea]|nr:hypothetical protein HDV00_002341 [Rhizophlyctis rosea]